MRSLMGSMSTGEESQHGWGDRMTGANVSLPGLVDATEIGRGGFGTVYRATEVDLGREVAVKVLTGGMDEQSRSRFERERRAMGALSSHPNIITIFRTGAAEDGALYLVMEYLPRGSLAERIAKSGPSPWGDVLRVGIELCGALESAHRTGVLHRDVKPGNVMMDELGRAKLGDFGIARLEGSPETKSSVITASVAHAPPEVIAGNKPDERSDVYSLASTLFEMASGSPAFVRSTDESMIPMFARIVREPTPDLRQQGIPDGLATALERAMSKEAEDRFPTAEDFGRALVEVQRATGETETQLWVAGEPQQTAASDQSTKVVPRGAADEAAALASTVGPTPSAEPSSPPQPSPAYEPQRSAPQPVAHQAGAQHPAPIPGTSTQYTAPPSASPGTEAPKTGGYGPPPGPAYNSSPPAQPSTSGGSQTGLLAAIGVGCLALIAVVGVWAANRSDNEADTRAIEGAGQDQDSDDTTVAEPEPGSISESADSSTDAPAAPQTSSTAIIESPVPSNPPRLDLLSDLPSLPAVETPYFDFRTVIERDGAFTYQVPTEWVDDLPTAGQVISSPDNNAALADELISGVVVSGVQGFGVWDANLYLDSLLEELANPEARCTEIKREPFVDGPFDGLVYAESCSGGALLVVDVVVSNPDRDAIIFIGMQLTDERDFAAFEEVLDSFLLFDSLLLPEAS